MDLLVVGDVHGCYHSLRHLLEQHWPPQRAVLVQLGDLINKGPHSARTLQYWMQLQEAHPGRVHLLRGNHEQLLINCHQSNRKNADYRRLVTELKYNSLPVNEALRWLRTTPLSYYAPQALVTHAGLARQAHDPYRIEAPDSVVNNRKKLLRLARPQVVGHTIIKEGRPLFSTNENAWYIDTGAWQGGGLSGLYFSTEGPPRVVQVPTHPEDRSGAS